MNGRKLLLHFFFQAEDGIRDKLVTGVQTCALPILRAIFHGPDFWAAQNVRVKVKTPLEFVVSAARAVAAEPDTSPRLAQVVARLGEPLYLHVAPEDRKSVV